MILDLTVKNFLSFKDEQVFSLYAENNLTKHEQNLTYPDDKIGTLKVSGIMGSNASGKSNLIASFSALRYLIIDSGDLKDGDHIGCYEPYLLSEQTKNASTSFEIEFWLNKTRYNYKIEYDRYNINYECLEFYPKNKAAKLFERTSATDWQTDDGVTFGTYYKGGRKRFAFFPNNTLLSKAGNSPDAPQIIRDVYNYFRKKWSFISIGTNVNVLHWQTDPNALNAMKCLINNIDLGISSFDFKEKEISDSQMDLLNSAPDHIRKVLIEEMSTEVIFNHLDENGHEIAFPNELESVGTKRLFDALPMILLTLKRGSVLFCDEIESSFHSHVVELIIKLFQDSSINVNSAQLIFTTHNLNTMKSKLFRKDQIWLAEKNDGATELSSLDQFNSVLRDNSPFSKWYDEGRLGGIPSINYGQIKKTICTLMDNNDA